MSGVRIEFRCSEEEKEKIQKRADREGMTKGEFLMSQTIYKRGRGRSMLRRKEKACICRMCTCFNKIEAGIQKEENRNQIIEECKILCQSLK